MAQKPNNAGRHADCTRRGHINTCSHCVRDAEDDLAGLMQGMSLVIGGMIAEGSSFHGLVVTAKKP